MATELVTFDVLLVSLGAIKRLFFWYRLQIKCESQRQSTGESLAVSTAAIVTQAGMEGPWAQRAPSWEGGSITEIVTTS